jgi:hypothetical protein
MDDPQFWCRMEERFRRLQAAPPKPGEVEHDSHNGLCAHWRGEKTPEGWDPWFFSNAGDGTKKLFKRAAERASVELRHLGGPTAVFFWLDLLRQDGLCWESQGDRGHIYRVCFASAEYCLKLETDVQAAANAMRVAWIARGTSEQRPAAESPGLIEIPSELAGQLKPSSQIKEIINEFRAAYPSSNDASSGDTASDAVEMQSAGAGNIEGDAERQRKVEKDDADYGAMLRRYGGRHMEEAQRQEELLRDARRYTAECLAGAVSDLQLALKPSEVDLEAACDEIRNRLVLRTWEDFLPRHKNYSDFRPDFREFKAALWNEEFPSLGERAMAAIRKRAAESAGGIASDSVAATQSVGAGNAEPDGPFPARNKIEEFANEAYAIARDRILKEYAEKKNKALAEVRRTKNSGGYVPALAKCGVERTRETILALADAWVEAFTLHRVPSEAYAEQDLEKNAQLIAAGTISGIEGELDLLIKRTGRQLSPLGHPSREIHAAMTTALAEAVVRLRRQRIAQQIDRSSVTSVSRREKNDQPHPIHTEITTEERICNMPPDPSALSLIEKFKEYQQVAKATFLPPVHVPRRLVLGWIAQTRGLHHNQVTWQQLRDACLDISDELGGQGVRLNYTGYRYEDLFDEEKKMIGSGDLLVDEKVPGPDQSEGHLADVAVQQPFASPKKRGRKRVFKPEQIKEASTMKRSGKSNNEIAKVLYHSQSPTPSQRRSVSTILRYHLKLNH